MSNELHIPEGLSPLGRQAAETILKVISDTFGGEDIYTGGCRAFYSPAEWKARGETDGLNAELIVVYDGGDLSHFFYSSAPDYKWLERMENALSDLGVYAEAATCWYSGIYTD